MTLFSTSKHSEEECAPGTAGNNPEMTTTRPFSATMSSSMASSRETLPPYTTSTSTSTPILSPPPYTPSASTSTPRKAPSAGHRSVPAPNWPIIPGSGDYQARIAQLEDDSNAQPHKKSWLKDKLNMVDPNEREYYERRYTASGHGSDFEQTTRLAALAGGAGYFSFPSRKNVHRKPSETRIGGG
jgi:hypothetical protein